MNLRSVATASCQHVFQPASKNDRLISVPISVGQFACTPRNRPPRRILSTKHGWLTGLMGPISAQPDNAAAHVSPSDAAEGGLSQYLGNLCFRSNYSTYLWNTSISAPYRVIRIAAMTLISLLLLARSWRLFIRSAAALYCRLELHAKDSKQADWLTCLMNHLNALRECCRSSSEGAILLAAFALAGWQFGIFTATALVVFALILTLAKQLASTPEVNAGHRAGGKGFAGKRPG